jgi:hypothetical protein
VFGLARPAVGFFGQVDAYSGRSGASISGAKRGAIPLEVARHSAGERGADRPINGTVPHLAEWLLPVIRKRSFLSFSPAVVAAPAPSSLLKARRNPQHQNIPAKNGMVTLEGGGEPRRSKQRGSGLATFM